MHDPQPPASGRWIAAAVVAHTLWTSAAPAMSYPLYSQEWGLTAPMTAIVFATYPTVVVLIMMLLGNIGGDLGLKMPMVLGMVGSIAGVTVFAFATGFPMLVIGRILMGIGVGLSAGPSAAALTTLAGDRGASITVVAQSAGFVGALALGGVLTQYAAFPLRTPFLLLDVLLISVMLWLLRLHLPETVAHVRPRLTMPRKPVASPELAASILALVTAYSHGVITTYAGATIAGDLVGSSNVAVNGLALSLFPLAFGLVGFLAPFRKDRGSVLAGSAATIVGMLLLLAAIELHSFVAFFLAIAMSGLGYALLVSGGLHMATQGMEPGARSARLTWALMWAYVSSGILALALGQLTALRGFEFAMLCAMTAMVVLALTTILQALKLARSYTPETV